jgi:hypothetical protein
MILGFFNRVSWAPAVLVVSVLILVSNLLFSCRAL